MSQHALPSMNEARPKAAISDVRSVGAERTRALLGDRPLLTLTADASQPGECISVQLVRVGASFFGLIDDNSIFCERLRLGMHPRFVMHADADTGVLCGELRARLHGRVDVTAAAASRGMPAGIADVAARALGQQLQRMPFGARNACVVELTPTVLAIDDDHAGEPRGSVPRT